MDRLSGSWPDRFVPRWGSSKERERARSSGEKVFGLDDDDSDFDPGEGPLDGEEGVVVDDEACFVDGWEGKVGEFGRALSPLLLLHGKAHLFTYPQTSSLPSPKRSRSTSCSTSTFNLSSSPPASPDNGAPSPWTTSSGATSSTRTNAGELEKPRPTNTAGEATWPSPTEPSLAVSQLRRV